MTDIAYRCHHCGSMHEAESIRQNLYLNQRPIASYEPSKNRFMNASSELFLRWRITKHMARALWPKNPHQSHRG
jgi:hypothetical protein